MTSVLRTYRVVVDEEPTPTGHRHGAELIVVLASAMAAEHWQTMTAGQAHHWRDRTARRHHLESDYGRGTVGSEGVHQAIRRIERRPMHSSDMKPMLVVSPALSRHRAPYETAGYDHKLRKAPESLQQGMELMELALVLFEPVHAVGVFQGRYEEIVKVQISESMGITGRHSSTNSWSRVHSSSGVKRVNESASSADRT